jgi:hypothetical protein
MIDINELAEDVARETGRPRYIVRRILDLMTEAPEYNAVIMLFDGKLWVVHDDLDDRIPLSLQNEIERSYDDIVELLGPIYRACDRAATGSTLQ